MSEIHQQNSETRQTPVLTLDPSSVAKEKVQMEETTQQLDQAEDEAQILEVIADQLLKLIGLPFLELCRFLAVLL